MSENMIHINKGKGAPVLDRGIDMMLLITKRLHDSHNGARSAYIIARTYELCQSALDAECMKGTVLEKKPVKIRDDGLWAALCVVEY